jgi:hypothetical protein
LSEDIAERLHAVVFPTYSNDVPRCLHDDVSLTRQVLQLTKNAIPIKPEQHPVRVGEQCIVADTAEVQIMR